MSTTVPSSSSASSSKPSNLGMGLTGLENLGNSCYMNSALQCLSNIEPLTSFILNGSCASEINYSNKITQGKIATSYIQLINNLWADKPRYAPRDFKQVIGKIDSRWAGFQQQDVHEFLQFLLNCLNDDFNRTKERLPPVEIDEKNKTEQQLANEYWEAEKKRENSLITDLFRGLFKSQLHCPTCSKTFTKFESFLDISLQIPSKNTMNFSMQYLPPHNKAEKRGFIKFRITMKPTATIRDLKKAIVDRINLEEEISSVDHTAGLGVRIENIIVAEVFDDQFSRIFTKDSETLSAINPRDNIYAYHIAPYKKKTSPAPASPAASAASAAASASLLQFVTIPVVQRASWPSLSEDKLYTLKTSFVAPPFFVTVPRNVQYGELRLLLRERVLDIVTVLDGSVIGKKGVVERELLERFCVWKVDRRGVEGERLLDLEDRVVVLSGNSWLAIEWNLKGFQNNQFIRTKPYAELEINTAGDLKAEEEELSVEDCISDFTKVEKLTEEESWYCPHCKEHKQATKKIDVWRTPEVLVLHLKRFETRGFWSGRKISKMVRCPSVLDLEGLVKDGEEDGLKRKRYELVAVANHYGLSPQGGHYTAICKNQKSADWFNFDDAKVSKLAPPPPGKDEGREGSLVVTKDAYLLFYKAIKEPQ